MALDLGVDMEHMLSDEISSAFVPMAPFACHPAG